MKKSQPEDELFNEFPPVPTSDWENRIQADLKGADYTKKLIWNTEDGYAVKPYYRADDLKGLDYLEMLREQNPFIFNCNGQGGWLIRQDIHTADISRANRCAQEAIERGVDAVAFNTEKVSSPDQMTALLKGINPEKTAIYFTGCTSCQRMLDLFIDEINQRGLSSEKIAGGLNFDPVSKLLLQGEFNKPFNEDLGEAEHLINAVRDHLPLFRVITVNGHYFQDSGSTLVQELAFSLATGNEYLNALTGKGISADVQPPGILFHFASGPDYFPEIAKLRAARILWARIVEQYEPGRQESLQMFIHSSTSVLE